MLICEWISNDILSHYQQGSNETRYIVSDRIFGYIYVRQLQDK